MKKVLLLAFLFLCCFSKLAAQSTPNDGLRRVTLRQGHNPWRVVTTFCHYSWLAESMRLSDIKTAEEAHRLRPGRQIVLPDNCIRPASSEVSRETAKILVDSQAYLVALKAPEGRLRDQLAKLRQDLNATQNERDKIKQSAAELENQVKNLQSDLALERSVPKTIVETPGGTKNFILGFAFGLIVASIIGIIIARKRTSELEPTKQRLQAALADRQKLERILAESLPKRAVVEFEGKEYLFTLDENSYTCPLCGGADLKYENLRHHLHKRCPKLKSDGGDNGDKSSLGKAG